MVDKDDVVKVTATVAAGAAGLVAAGPGGALAAGAAAALVTDKIQKSQQKDSEDGSGS